MILSAPGFFLGSFFIIMKKIRVKIMTNELIAVLFIIVNFTLVMLSYKLFGQQDFMRIS